MAEAKTYNGADYDFVAMFDCLHDMGDPVGTAVHVRETLTEEGAWTIVEPYASDRVEEDLNPIGRTFTPPRRCSGRRTRSSYRPDHPEPDDGAWYPLER